MSYDNSNRNDRLKPGHFYDSSHLNDPESNSTYGYYYDEYNHVDEGKYYSPDLDNYEYYQLPEARMDFYREAYERGNTSDNGRETDSYADYVRNPYRRRYTAYRKNESQENSAMGTRYIPRRMRNNLRRQVRPRFYTSMNVLDEGAGYADDEIIDMYGMAGKAGNNSYHVNSDHIPVYENHGGGGFSRFGYYSDGPFSELDEDEHGIRESYHRYGRAGQKSQRKRKSRWPEER